MSRVRTLVGAFPILALLCAASCSPQATGVWIRVAEAGCETAVSLLTTDGARTICPLAIDLVRLLDELTAAHTEGRDAVISWVDPDLGGPVRLVVPAASVQLAAQSTREALAVAARPRR